MKKIINKKKKRLSVFRSNKYFYVQLIDDVLGETLCSLSTKEIKEKQLTKLNLNIFAEKLSEKLLKLEIKEIVFDKGNTIYKQNVALLADAIRSYGIIF